MGALDTHVLRPHRRIVFERPWVIVFEAPAGGRWQSRDDARRSADGTVCRELRFRVTTDDAVLVLAVKDYAGPHEGRASIDDLLRHDWQRAYGGLLADIEALQTEIVPQPFMSCTLPGVEVIALGMGAMGGAAAPVLVRERHVPIEGHMLVVSAMGARTLVEQYARDVERWFDSVAFRL